MLEFNWTNKEKMLKDINLHIHNKQLQYIHNRGFNEDTTSNIYIEGDNLDALKLLYKNYNSKIKMIYIDPPYNTGHNEFTYNDKHKKNISGDNHSDWINTIYPRIAIAKQLLTDDGVICISIDEREVHHLRLILDEIFTEKAFITCISLEIKKTQGMAASYALKGTVAKNIEYILVYSKQPMPSKRLVTNILYDSVEGYDIHFSDYIEINNSGDYTETSLSEYMKTDVILSSEFQKYKIPISLKNISQMLVLSPIFKKRLFSISENIFRNNPFTDPKLDIPLNTITMYKGRLIMKLSSGKYRYYSPLSETLHQSDDYISSYGRSTVRGNLWRGFYSDTANLSKEGNVVFQNGKKPVRLIKQLAKWFTHEDSIILDFYSGSATTGHAIIDLNYECNSQRKFILVQKKELCNETSKSYKEGYESISDLGIQRLKNVCNQYSNLNTLDNGFKVYEIKEGAIKDEC